MTQNLKQQNLIIINGDWEITYVILYQKLSVVALAGITSLFFLSPATPTTPGPIDPIDVFVLIEVKYANSNKSGDVVKTEYNTFMNDINTAINTTVNGLVAQNANYYSATPHYAFVPGDTGSGEGPILTLGKKYETLGFIYNTRTINPVGGRLLIDQATNDYIRDRPPFAMSFNEIATKTDFHIVANHAPPLGMGGALREYKPPIDYTNLLQQCATSQTNNPLPLWSHTFILGDFNCSINSTYYPHGLMTNPPIKSFLGIFNTPPPCPTPYHSITNGSLSSVKTGVPAGSGLPPINSTNYLNNAYDDIIFDSANINPSNSSSVVDFIGKARDMGTGQLINQNGTPLPTVNSLVSSFYTQISDHLPVCIEF